MKFRNLNNITEMLNDKDENTIYTLKAKVTKL